MKTIILPIIIFCSLSVYAGDVDNININPDFLEHNKQSDELSLTESVTTSSCSIDGKTGNSVINKTATPELSYSFDCGGKNYKLKRLVHSRMVDFRNVLDNTLNMSQFGQMFRVNMVTSGVEPIAIKHYVDFSDISSISVMVRQFGIHLYFIPTSERQNLSFDISDDCTKSNATYCFNKKGGDYFDENIAGYLTLTYQTVRPGDEHMFKTDVIGKCQDFGYNRPILINITQAMEKDACLVDGRRPSFLSWYLFEK